MADAELSHTDWGLIRDAAGADAGSSSDALDRVVRRYWPAVYAFIRRSGRSVHQASDLTQGFICDVMLHRGLLVEASPQRGRFRSLLLTALQNYLRERHRHDTRLKRGSAEPLEGACVDAVERAMSRAADARDDTPARAFAHQWAATLIQRVIESVREQCVQAQLGPHWTIFEHRVVRPMLLGEPAADYPSLMSRLDIKSAAQAANMLMTVKRRFARTLLKEIARTVDSRADVEDELRQLLRELETAR